MSTIALAVALLCVGLGLGAAAAYLWAQSGAGSLKARAERLLAEAQAERERLLREAELDAKGERLRAQEAAEAAQRAQREELSGAERRLRQREAGLDKKAELVDARERDLRQHEGRLTEARADVERRLRAAEQAVAAAEAELARVGGLSREAAREELVRSVEDEARKVAAGRVRRVEDEARREAEERARSVVASAIQRLAGGYVAEKTVSVVELPSDEMKGRIIGREGRNIRAIEAATGVDVIIDDTPEVVVVSAFNPMRREVARLALERLVADGRIHPARIEEIVEQVSEEVEQQTVRAGEQASLELGLHGVHPELVRLVGKLRFRSVTGQNLWNHVMETAAIAGLIAEELGANPVLARRAGLLHDVGKAVDHEAPGHHAVVGAEQAQRYGEKPEVVSAIRHYHEEAPPTLLGVILQVADRLSRQRPGARREQYETHIKRLEELERLSLAFRGVSRAYALQAGREVRVIVDFSQISDDEAVLLSHDIARRIQDTLTYPGEVRVTVIREARATEIAR